MSVSIRLCICFDLFIYRRIKCATGLDLELLWFDDMATERLDQAYVRKAPHVGSVIEGILEGGFKVKVDVYLKSSVRLFKWLEADDEEGSKEDEEGSKEDEEGSKEDEEGSKEDEEQAEASEDSSSTQWGRCQCVPVAHAVT